VTASVSQPTKSSLKPPTSGSNHIATTSESSGCAPRFTMRQRTNAKRPAGTVPA
jgi:hypothetical protein